MRCGVSPDRCRVHVILLFIENQETWQSLTTSPQNISANSVFLSIYRVIFPPANAPCTFPDDVRCRGSWKRTHANKHIAVLIEVFDRKLGCRASINSCALDFNVTPMGISYPIISIRPGVSVLSSDFETVISNAIFRKTVYQGLCYLFTFSHLVPWKRRTSWVDFPYDLNSFFVALNTSYNSLFMMYVILVIRR
jgi:hypothetical protein